jgi:thioesterase domain-containing protein
MVTFEAARLLMAADHQVDMVAMIDPPTVSARPATRAILRLMKPLVSPRLLRGTFERMAQLERYSKASTSAPIVIAKVKIPPALWDAYSIAMAQHIPAQLEVLVAFTRPNTTAGRGGISVRNSKSSRCLGDIMAA